MRTATLGSVPCLPSNIDRFLSRQPIAVRRGASENGQNSKLQVSKLEEGGTLCCDGDRAGGRVNQDDNAGHDPAIRAAIVVAHGPLKSRGLPRWVHRLLPPLRFAAREPRSATGRGPPMDYLDNPLPGSIPAGAHSRAGKKVRISTGVHNCAGADMTAPTTAYIGSPRVGATNVPGFRSTPMCR